MTTGEIFQESLKTAMFGMGLVLGTLFILSLILDLMRVIFTPKTVKKNEAVDEPIAKEEQTVGEPDDTELIAVITAALSDYMEKPISAIKINAIHQIHKKPPLWGVASRLNHINNKL